MSTTTEGKWENAADFIRSLPDSLTIREMMSAARSVGFKLALSSIRNTRYRAGKTFKHTRGKAPPVKKVVARTTPPETTKVVVMTRTPTPSVPAPVVQGLVNPNATHIRRLVLHLGVIQLESLLGELKREADLA